MSSNVCQGIQLAPPIINEPQLKNNNGELLGGRNFIEALTNPSKTHQKSPHTDTEKVYVHPLTKRSASMLSEKSLNMCTESLGSETGSDTSDDNFDYFSSPKSSHSKNYGTTTLKSPKKICRRADNFPPPLTSISGPGGCVRVNSHREDGRLVMKAVTVPISQKFFHAERVDGRLTLHFVSEKTDIKAQVDEDVDEVKEYETEEGEIETFETEFDESVSVEDMDVINGSVGGKIGTEKFQTTRRCKQNGHRIKETWNLEAYWVASS